MAKAHCLSNSSTRKLHYCIKHGMCQLAQYTSGENSLLVFVYLVHDKVFKTGQYKPNYSNVISKEKKETSGPASLAKI